MNKIFYMMSIILISFFVGGCSEEEDSISGSWTGDSYQINFSASTFYDVDDDGMVDEGEEMDLTCSSDLLQNEYIYVKISHVIGMVNHAILLLQ